MNVEDPDQLLQAVLPPALEVLTAWSIAEIEADPSVFHQAMDRALGDAAAAPDPLRAPAQMMFGLSSLSGILLDELAQITGRPAAKSCTTSTSATSTPPYRPDMETYRGETWPENPDMSPCRDGRRRLIGRRIECSYAMWFAASYLH